MARAFWASCAVVAMAVAGDARAQESAIDGIRAQTSAHPADWRAALSLGRAFRRAGRWNEAEPQLRSAKALAGSDVHAAAAVDAERARLAEDRGDFSSAAATCRKMILVTAVAAEGHACLAGAHLLWQRASEALVETSLALAKDPQLYDAREAEGRAYELELDASRAESSLREAIALRPDEASGHMDLGRVLWTAGKHDDGLAELRKAVSLDPADPVALFQLASVLPPSAERAGLLEHATRERPTYVAAQVALAGDRLAAGHVAEAKEAALAASRADAANVPARVILGKVALAEGRADEAILAGERVLKSFANSAPAKLLVADGNAKKGEIDVALEAYQAAWGLDHGDPTPLVHASEACHAAGRDTSARAFGVRATQEFPDYAPGWVALGDALAGQGEKAAARDAYAKALAAPSGAIDRDAVKAKQASIR